MGYNWLKKDLVNWNLVTKNKAQGGLGLRKARTKNLSLLANLAWRLANNPTNLWAITLLQKYSKNLVKSALLFEKLSKDGKFANKEYPGPSTTSLP